MYYMYFFFFRLPVKFLITAFWVWATSFLAMYITKVVQKYKDHVAFQNQKDRFDKLLSNTKGKETKEDTQPSTSLAQNVQHNQEIPKTNLILVEEAPNGDRKVIHSQSNPNSENVTPNEVDSQPIVKEALPPIKVQLNNQAVNPEVFTVKVVFLSFILMWLINVPIWLLYLFDSNNFSQLFTFIQLNLLPHLSSSLILPPITLAMDKEKYNFYREVITDIFS